jgi:hypothetical protein
MNEYAEIKDVLVVEENVRHRETRREFLLLFSKKMKEKKLYQA